MQFFETAQGTMVLGSLIAIMGVLFGLGGAILVGLSRRLRLVRHPKPSMQRDIAMRTILALDDFVGEAYMAVHDTPEFNPNDLGEFVFHADSPLFVLPSNVDWSEIKQELAEELQWLPNRVQNVVDGLQSLDLSLPGNGDFFQHRQEDFSRLGLDALFLIDRLSAAYGVKRPERPPYYSPEAGFRKKIAETEAFWRRRRSSLSAVPQDGSNVTPLFGSAAAAVRDQFPDPLAE
ncbi:hypothetical protein [Rhizobium sp. CECT 9324]|uniref:hypothetical protein n=1 Tax=Rhizobium sp. CECT 9324 TaxID=2845820 RepID=UPI001E51B24B|nr:hypothetical protein [Rhizobium sp. CECT 9324]CAH0343202.1 hypothetical protein RHI9324_04935 [Rhizobium sp. CECT 9324]